MLNVGICQFNYFFLVLLSSLISHTPTIKSSSCPVGWYKKRAEYGHRIQCSCSSGCSAFDADQPSTWNEPTTHLRVIGYLDGCGCCLDTDKILSIEEHFDIKTIRRIPLHLRTAAKSIFVLFHASSGSPSEMLARIPTISATDSLTV